MLTVTFTRPGHIGVHLGDDPTRTAGPGELESDRSVERPEWSEDRLLGPIFDLFAGRIDRAYGEDLEWWADTFCDIGSRSVTQVGLAAMSARTDDRACCTEGVRVLREALASRARTLIAKMDADQIEALQ